MSANMAANFKYSKLFIFFPVAMCIGTKLEREAAPAALGGACDFYNLGTLELLQCDHWLYNVPTYFITF